MLDLDRPDVWPSTRQKIGQWAKQPVIKNGYLPIFDAACMMAKDGYGGLWKELTEATREEAEGLRESICRSLDAEKKLEGYPPEEQYVNGSRVATYPLVAYRDWCNRTGCGDARYFESRILQEGLNEPNPAGAKKINGIPITYSGFYSLPRSSLRTEELRRRRQMSVREFAAFYTGLDLEKIERDGSYVSEDVFTEFIIPIENFIRHCMVIEKLPDKPTDIDVEIPF